MASHILGIFFLNLMRMRFLANPNAAKVKLIKSLILSHNALSLKICGASNNEVIGYVAERKNQLLCSYYSVLIFNFSNIKHGYKIEI